MGSRDSIGCGDSIGSGDPWAPATAWAPATPSTSATHSRRRRLTGLWRCRTHRFGDLIGPGAPMGSNRSTGSGEAVRHGDNFGCDVLALNGSSVEETPSSLL